MSARRTAWPGRSGTPPPPTVGRRPLLSWRLETLTLVLIGLLLTAAMVNDLVRALGIDARKKVDKRTFLHYVVHSPPKHVEVQAGVRGKPDIACGRPHTGSRVRVCLIMTGTSHVLYRHVAGGYTLLLPHSDRKRYRSACSGYAVTYHLCPGT